MIWDLIVTASPLDLADILAVALLFYGLFRVFERTRTLQLLAVFLILAAALLSARRLNLLTLNVLIDRIWAVFLIATGVASKLGAPDVAIGTVVLAYLALCLYTWVSSPLVNAWTKLVPPR